MSSSWFLSPSLVDIVNSKRETKRVYHPSWRMKSILFFKFTSSAPPIFRLNEHWITTNKTDGKLSDRRKRKGKEGKRVQHTRKSWIFLASPRYPLWSWVALIPCWMWRAEASNVPAMLTEWSLFLWQSDSLWGLGVERADLMTRASASNVPLSPVPLIWSFTRWLVRGTLRAALIPTAWLSNLGVRVLGTWDWQ